MKVILIIAILFLILTPHEPPSVWVEIHDVSPVYGNGELERVIAVLERHDVNRVVIFVIPNHGGSAPLSRHPEFTDYLKELEKEGYEIGAHGYTHNGFEFYCGEDEVQERLNLSMNEFHAVGFDPQVFLAPRFFTKKESLAALEENFNEVYFFSKIRKDGQDSSYLFHEFTYFHLPEWVAMPIAKASYAASRSDVYRLSVHIDRTDEERLELLDEFLDFIDVQKRINNDS